MWPTAAVRRRWLRRLRRAPLTVRVCIGVLLAAILALGLNAIYQVVRKPTELFFPVSGTLYKTPQETWRDYAPIFRRYATRTITPELLAALAQVEGSGNPLVRTYWRWSWVPKPFELYRPASSAVGMYQITDGMFAEARHYCIHAHALVHEGRWNDWRACWFNSLYWRVAPSDAVELTSAYLDLKVTGILTRFGVSSATFAQQRHLAAAVHLCGAGAAATYVRQDFRFSDTQRCGDHDPRAYLRRVDAMHAVFARLAAAEEGGGAVDSQ
ncbi:MAG TPA: hypothetical protein VGD47_10350 [Steroidobacteraceae bacterium]